MMSDSSGVNILRDGGSQEEQRNLPEIKDLILGDTIGQGSFGCIKAAALKDHRDTVVAVKFIHLPTSKNSGLSENDVSKEVLLHSKCSKHQNILKLLECDIANDYLYIILEMADGGDLFDKIEPDVGVSNDVAQFYYQQLVNAIVYLHDECGIAHRDIKPENILLDKNGNLKLADFGLASQFKRKDGTCRLSRDERGSPPYMAPEILISNKKYYANLTDIWSIGIFVFVLLTGEIPWELPVKEDTSFKHFILNDGNLNSGPWLKIVDFNHLNLLRKILQPNPKQRASLRTLTTHPWYTKPNKFANSQGMCKDPSNLARYLLSNLKVSLSTETYDFFLSQDQYSMGTNKLRTDNIVSTQPVINDIADIEHGSHYRNDMVFSNTQRPSTQYDSIAVPKATALENRWMNYISKDFAALQFSTDNENDSSNINNRSDINLLASLKFNPHRLTKFYTIEPMESVLPILEESLHITGIKVKPGLYDNFLKLIDKQQNIRDSFPLIINIKTKDRRGGKLNGSLIINLIKDGLKALEFERKSGDPLEWRRLFKNIALLCRELILLPN